MDCFSNILIKLRKMYKIKNRSFRKKFNSYYAPSRYKKNSSKPKLLHLIKWKIKVKSPYKYKKRNIKRKTVPSWVARAIDKTFIESKNSWTAYFDLSVRAHRHRQSRKYIHQPKAKKNKNIYSLFGFTNYVYHELDRTQFPRINHLRNKQNLNKKWHKKMILMRFRIPNDVYRLYRPWKYKFLPHTILRSFIKHKYKHFYKIVGTDKKYKLKFFKTLKGAILKNSALDRLNNIWDELLWNSASGKIAQNYFTKTWKSWWTRIWLYRTSIFYTQLFFYKKKKIKRFIASRKPHLFRSYKKEQISTPWREALIFKRYLYVGNVILTKHITRKVLKTAIRFKNPLYEKKNKVFYWLYQLLNNRRAELIQKNKKLRIKQILKRIILSFYGNLKIKYFTYLTKKSHVGKSTRSTKRENLLKKLELRLDVLVYRLNIAPSIYWAQQFIKCGHIYISNNKSKDWQTMYKTLWTTSFSLYLRDPKYLYTWPWLNHLPLFDYKHILLPITRCNYILQPGMMIYTSPNSCLNKFKHTSNLFKKIIPSYLMTISDLKFAWNIKNHVPTAVSTTFWQKEYKHPLASLVLFNPAFSDLAINDRIKYDSMEWIVL